MKQIDHESLYLNKILPQLGIQLQALQNEKSNIMEEYTSKIEEFQKDVVQQAQIDFILPYFLEDLVNNSSNIEENVDELNEKANRYKYNVI